MDFRNRALLILDSFANRALHITTSVLDVFTGGDSHLPVPAFMHSAANSVTNVLVSDYFPLHIPHVDLLDHNLAIAIVATILLPLMWNLLGRLEYYTRIFSRLTIKRIIAVYLCAAVIAALSLYRTALIVVAIRSQQSLQTMDTPLFHALGGIIGILGFSFILGAYYQLGITGTYLGDYFGIFKEERITAFPFNLLDNPMYDGSSMMHLADAILEGSPAGLLLALWTFICYRIGCIFEEPFTAKMYAARDSEMERKRREKLKFAKSS